MKAQKVRFFKPLIFALVVLSLFFLAKVSLAQELLPFPIGQAFFPYVAHQPPAATFTLTPTPTATLTPTPTPTPTATPVPPRVKILSHHSYTSDGSLHIIGEVENQTGSDISDMMIKSSLKDSRNKTLDSQEDWLYLSYFPAGKRTCYHIIYWDLPSNWDSYKLSDPTYSIATATQADLEITSRDGEYHADTGEYTLSGTVRNDGNARAVMVKVIGSLYNKDDKILGCTYSYIDASYLYLNSGQSSSFEIEFYGRDFADVDYYKLQPDGTVP